MFQTEEAVEGYSEGVEDNTMDDFVNEERGGGGGVRVGGCGRGGGWEGGVKGEEGGREARPSDSDRAQQVTQIRDGRIGAGDAGILEARHRKVTRNDAPATTRKK